MPGMGLTVVSAAALVFALCCAVLLAFQLGLLWGQPWGELTLGGRWPGVLPRHARIITGFSMVLVIAFAFVMLTCAGWLNWIELSAWMPWAIVAYCTLGCIANAATPSARERRIWLPVVSIMLGCSLLVSLR